VLITKTVNFICFIKTIRYIKIAFTTKLRAGHILQISGYLSIHSFVLSLSV